MDLWVLHSIVVSIFIAATWSVGNQTSSKGISTSEDRSEGYIRALETFDVNNFKNSCKVLTSAVKALLELFDPTRWDQLDAPLYVLPKLRQESFSDVTYHRCCRLGSGTVLRVDILIYRVDGLTFAINRWPIAELMDSFKKNSRINETGLFYRNDNQLIKHAVFVGFIFNRTASSRRHGSKLLGFTATYLLDSYDKESSFVEHVMY
ncbi:unnamed protein product [Bemisia tabaci]|uniref:Uncharacterized protein n=1 Tax=Bemisia tabaci TaxID=7038 RepID=A0A9P0ABB6_BEMTA|nr:unnamed protein product [Bemisia tabaci]